MLYPLNFNLEGKRIVIVGGGPVAVRRAKGFLAAGAVVELITPFLSPKAAEMVEAGEVTHPAEHFAPEHLKGCFCVVAATNKPEVNRAVAETAREHGVLVNMAAPPMELSDFSVPAKVENGGLLLSIATGGASPELSRLLRCELEAGFAALYGPLTERLAAYRGQVQELLPDSGAREQFWRQTLDGVVLGLAKEGRYDEAEEVIKNAISSIGS